MTTAENIELALIPIFGAGLWLLSTELPNKVGVGKLLLGASVLLLFQGLIRDLWLLSKNKPSESQPPPRKASCLCVESTIGITGVVVGILALSFGIAWSVAMSNGAWSVLVMVIMTIGFAIKDYVIEWNPWRVRREKDHINIVFTWKR